MTAGKSEFLFVLSHVGEILKNGLQERPRFEPFTKGQVLLVVWLYSLGRFVRFAPLTHLYNLLVFSTVWEPEVGVLHRATWLVSHPQLAAAGMVRNG